MTERVEQSMLRIRTCIGCGAQRDKRHLVRIVRTADGPVFDSTSKANGRGAYVCGVECLYKARKAKKLQRALKDDVSTEDYDRLAEEIGKVASCQDVR